MAKTREQIEKLKRDWRDDGCWELEDTEGFEEHRAELVAFRRDCEAKWKAERRYTDSPWMLWRGKQLIINMIGENGGLVRGQLLQGTDAWLFLNVTSVYGRPMPPHDAIYFTHQIESVSPEKED